MPKPDMTLGVNVNVTGTLNGSTLTASATYSQATSNPPSTGVVASNGDIDLNQMTDPNHQFSNETDITFMLSGTITDGNGNSYNVVFPDTVDQAVTISQKGGGGHGQLAPSLVSTSSLLIDDTNNDGQDYSYCLTIEPNMISADGIPTCPLDPNIVNR